MSTGAYPGHGTLHERMESGTGGARMVDGYMFAGDGEFPAGTG
ncbi:hypothetical protein [Pseudonocardia sp. DSM 110487]|nr:hypothetical protein [Pseudonocardia sp. DSM 110487]